MSRLIWLAFIVSVLAVAAAQYWESVPKPFQRIDASDVGDLVTAELSKVNTKTFDQTGELNYDFAAESVTYLQVNPDAASTEDYAIIKQPLFRFYQTDRAPWHLRSLMGTAYNSNQTLVLEQDVRAWQELRDGGISEVLSSSLTIHPDPQIAETDKPVMIRFPGARYTAESMHANFATEVFNLGGHLEGIHEPTP